MTWQKQQVAATDTYKEFLTSLVAVATSKHVSAVVVNAGGTGYTNGDLLELRHASAEGAVTNLYCQLEVTNAIAGVIQAGGVRINNGGAYALRALSAVPDASNKGSGYSANEIVELQDGTGTSREKAKFRVTGETAGAVDTVALYETGGAYDVAPTLVDAATVGIGPAGFGGDDALKLDVTMKTLIGTTGVASTAITGAGNDDATFNITLTDTGMHAEWNTNEKTSDSVTDQKEVVLRGTVTGADAPYIGFFTYRADNGGEKRYGLACFGMLAWNPSLAVTKGSAGVSQPGIGPLAWVTGSNSGSHILIAEEVAESNIFGIHADGRCVYGFIRGNVATEADSYHQFFVGLGDGFGPTETSPYPMVVAASSNAANRKTSDVASTGLSEARQNPSGAGPIYFLQKSDLTWLTCKNATVGTNSNDYIMFPRGVMREASPSEHLLCEDDNYRRFPDGTIGSNIRANVTGKIYPAPGTSAGYTPLPLTICSSGASSIPVVDTTIVTRLTGCFFVGGVNASGTIHGVEDEIEDASGVRFVLTPCSTESLSNRPYQFVAMRED